MSPEQALQAGNAFARAHLQVIEAAYGKDVASAYAAGHAWAARDFVSEVINPRAAYDLCQDLADYAASTFLPEGA